MGVGLRYFLAADADSGYSLYLYEDGTAKLYKNGTSVAKTSGIKILDMNNLMISAVYGEIKGYINGAEVLTYTEDGTSVCSAGRAALFSSFNENCFDNVFVEEAGEDNYIVRYDNTDLLAGYEGTWNHTTMGSFRNYKRTSSSAESGAAFTVSFSGTGIGITGIVDEAVLLVEIDGEIYDALLPAKKSSNHEYFMVINGLEPGEHILRTEIVSGSVSLDSIEIFGEEK